MEILPGVHQLCQDMTPVYPGVVTTINLVAGSRLAVVDTGIPQSAQSLVLPYLAKLGRRPDEIAAIVITHGHGDHLGSNEELKRLSGAPIMVHEGDAANLDRQGRWVDTVYNPGPADVRLKAGDVVEAGDVRLEIVGLPGHSPGSIGVYLRSQGVLFTGDSLQGLGTTSQNLAFYNDPDAYVASVEKALGMDVAHLVPAHVYAPATAAHIHGPDVRRFLEVSLEFALGLDALILGVLRQAREPLTPAAVADPICARYGMGPRTGMATMTVSAHLKRLAALGEVRVAGEGLNATYSPV
jgi:glyoxylase-like metal-dependent hydrolase (beta-lactamase superfamily II)